jgi:hypothetical protein
MPVMVILRNQQSYLLENVHRQAQVHPHNSEGGFSIPHFAFIPGMCALGHTLFSDVGGAEYIVNFHRSAKVCSQFLRPLRYLTP